ncbi:Periplasmic murein peptide-binding protein [Lentibacillus sp. JNUCC-1]|uniref:glutathione ABC transporter substrate-binding protein n=1 Tax=Lentibacillus sp. JNUCC-1 TaxID=2654513 RepID=UPI0012E844FA|nr:glutathione ABC transporter substrate-binding protein [Lentibacillus sp. JNUCC-1]MUV36791.1 Periplasmic murein peptide-binding protein [Lentibacillus sp. JNUCC-1]
MKRRFMYNAAMMVVLLSILLMSACSTGGGDTEAKGDSGEKAAEKKGGTLKIAMQSDATNMDPHFITNIKTANVLHGKVYETLVEFDQEMNIVPKLAESWDQLDDTTWEFKLQKDVTFHDGTPFNADAVKATYDRLLDPETGSPQRDKISMIEEVKVVDDSTVQLLLSEPYAPLLSILSSQEASILNPEILENDPDSLSKKPNGTGPFKFENWNSGQDITLVKNDDYWGEEANVSKVVFEVVPEDATRLAMLETGEAHISDQVPVNDIERVESADNMRIERVEGLAVEFLGFNVESDIFDDVKLRKAVSHAIEREAIIEGIYNDVGTLANSAMSPNVIGYSENATPYDYDLNKAKDLVKESGFDTSKEITLITNDRKERVDMAEVIQSQLKGIGLNVNIQVLEYGSFIESLDKGKNDMFISGWGNATGDGDYNQYNLFHTDSHGSAGNTFFYSNDEVDQLIEKGRATSDQEKRDKIYEKTQQIELEDAVYVPIRNYEQLAAANEAVQNFKVTPVGYLDINEATLTK